MKNGKVPDPNVIHPIAGYDKEIYVKPTITNPNIIVGDFTYIADSEFESHVTHLYEWNGDRLIIGKFCQIAAGVEFVMNGANHQLNAVTTFPFYTLEGWNMDPPASSDLPLKGDTVIGNDVWIGQNAVILPGVHIGDGAIIGAIELKLNGHTDMTDRDDECELGYWLGKLFWGQGIVPEAVKEMLRHAFEDCGMTKVWVGYYDGNEKSRRVQEKCKFRYQWKSEDVDVPLLHERRMGHVSSMTKDQWQWDRLYVAASAVRNERRISEYVTCGEV